MTGQLLHGDREPILSKIAKEIIVDGARFWLLMIGASAFDNPGNNQRTHGDHTATTQRSSREHAENTQRTHRPHPESALRRHGEHLDHT